MRKKHNMKILYLDIETAPILVYVWQLLTRYVNPGNIVSHGYTLCWAAMWEGGREVFYSSIKDDGMEVMLQKMHDLLDEADAVVHFNGSKFDMPVLNREFVTHSMPPPSHYHQIDLLKTIRSQFRFESNRLDYVCQRLGLGGKLKHKGMSLWFGCMEGNLTDWATMERYNKRDIKLLRNLYKFVLPWIHNHPNVGMWITNPTAPVCPTCGSKDLIEKGTQYNTKVASYKRYHCNQCKTPVRSRLSDKATSPNVMQRTPK